MTPFLKRALYKLSFLALLYLLFFLFLDPVLRFAAVKAGEGAAGAKVEITGLKTGLFPPRLEIKGVAVADATQPMQNVVEFERAAFTMEGGALLQKKFVIGEAALEGLKFSTPRKSSGALPKLAAQAEKAQPGLTNSLTAQATGFSLEKVGQAKEGLKETYSFKKEDLESYKLAESLQADYNKRVEDWQKKLAAADFEGRAKAVSQKIEAAQAENDKMKKVKDLQAALKDAQKLSKEGKDFEKAMKEDLGKASQDLQAVQEARKRDTARVMEKLKLPSLDAESISAFLLGPEMAAKAKKALTWIQWARAKMPPGAKKPAPPVRGKGMNVPFALAHSYPMFAIRLMKITGELPGAGGKALSFSGQATGITTEQALLGQPLELHLASERRSAFHVDVVLDHRKDTPVDTLDLGYEGLMMAARELGSPDSISVKVSAGTGGLTTALSAKGDALDGKIVFAERGVTLTPVIGAKGGGELVKRVAVSALAGLDRFEAVVSMKGTLQHPDFGISSSLGKALADGLKKALGGEIDAKRKEIEGKLNSVVGEKTDSIQKDVIAKQGPMLSKLGVSKDLEKKVQDAIDKAQKSLLKPGKVPDLKKLFK